MLLKRQDFILFNGRIIFHCVYIHYIFFIHSFVDGHLGCFHILAIVNHAAVVYAGCIYLFKLVFSFSSDKYPKMELLDHVVILF